MELSTKMLKSRLLTLTRPSETSILEFEDENGQEKTFVDYNIQTNDSLHLISVPAYACPVPFVMEKEIWEDFVR